MTETNAGSGRVLLVGLACLDVVNVCPHYPVEDEDIRATEQVLRRGGNASNSSAVLAQLRAGGDLLCTLATGWETEYVVADLKGRGIKLDHCVHHSGCRLPTSYVVLSAETGSRTIVHYRNLPELTVEDFLRLDLSQYSWIHFEGRNVNEVLKMIAAVEEYRSAHSSQRLHTSVEIEKVRRPLYQLFDRTDVVFVSKEVAQDLGYQSAKAAVCGLKEKAKPGATIVCAWGTAGADGYCPVAKHVHSDVFPPVRVVDTLAAGDTFNAAVIHCLDGGHSLHEAITFACRLAGAKCGQMGLDGIVELLPQTVQLEFVHANTAP